MRTNLCQFSQIYSRLAKNPNIKRPLQIIIELTQQFVCCNIAFARDMSQDQKMFLSTHQLHISLAMAFRSASPSARLTCHQHTYEFGKLTDCDKFWIDYLYATRFFLYALVLCQAYSHCLRTQYETYKSDLSGMNDDLEGFTVKPSESISSIV